LYEIILQGGENKVKLDKQSNKVGQAIINKGEESSMGKKAIRKLMILLLAVVLITSNSLILSGSAFAAVDQAPAVVAINITPITADGKIVSGMPKISVNPTDDKGITKVEFYTKAVSAPDSSYYKIKTVTAAPYIVNLATSPWVADGEYTLKVVVYNTANQTAY